MTHVISSLLMASALLFSSVVSAATLTADFFDANGKPLTDAVLTLQGPAGKPDLAPKADMDQRDQRFAPHVLA
nr:hypothetical protein [Tanacetum cinerariifolium]